jgi:hypothetical protein
MRVAHRNAPDYGIYGLLKLLAKRFFGGKSPGRGKWESPRIPRFEWWAWVDLNHVRRRAATSKRACIDWSGHLAQRAV